MRPTRFATFRVGASTLGLDELSSDMRPAVRKLEAPAALSERLVGAVVVANDRTGIVAEQVASGFSRAGCLGFDSRLHRATAATQTCHYLRIAAALLPFAAISLQVVSSAPTHRLAQYVAPQCTIRQARALLPSALS